MNLVAQLWRYLTKVYDLPRRLRGVRDTRVYPDIPTPSVSAGLFLGAILRLPSFRQMAIDSARAGWRRLLKLRRRIHRRLAPKGEEAASS